MRRIKAQGGSKDKALATAPLIPGEKGLIIIARVNTEILASGSDHPSPLASIGLGHPAIARKNSLYIQGLLSALGKVISSAPTRWGNSDRIPQKIAALPETTQDAELISKKSNQD